MSPERPGSAQSEAALAAPRMSEPGSPIAYTPINNAQSPISILLAVAQSQKVPDDDLTSLSWLHEGDVLKGMNINASPPSSTTSTPVKNNVSFLPDQSPTSDYVDDSSVGTPESSTCTVVNSPNPKTTPNSNHQDFLPMQNSSNQNMRSLNVPYDPQVHVQSKPPYSFSCIIFMAIEDSKQKALPVKEIYAWILDHFPYFKNAPTGWKNSVRHNLSLNKCFQKVEKVPNLGKGSLWTVDPQYKPNLIESLNRSPFYPCPTIEGSIAYATSTKNNTQSSIKDEMIGNKGTNLPNPELFPYLSRKLAATGRSMQHPNVKSEQEESLDAADAAAVMLSLKHAARVNKVKQEMQVITTSPSQDHTYSAADSGDNEDEAFESDEDKKRLKVVRRKINFEDDEERRIKEGAETLLNLATLVTNKRTIMDNSDCEPQTKIPRFLDAQEENSCEEQKHVPFQPRMLRVKRKENPSPKKVFNNNQDEWLKHRRELDINQSR